jgi:serine/threonine protein kinase
MAEVWLTAEARGGSIVLKTLRPQLRGTRAAGRLLEHEHQVLQAVRHRCIVTTFGLVDSAVGPALALEYLAGGDLVPLVGTHPRLWLRAAADVVAALAHVHACGYAYRDLKARNVLFDAAGRARLIDFAAALPFGEPQPVGGTTRAYRPNVEPAVVGPGEDCTALAVLLYELLAGRLPFGAAGETRGAVVPPLAAAHPAAVAVLAALVTDTLQGGARRGSLSDFAAVIDTVAAGIR